MPARKRRTPDSEVQSRPAKRSKRSKESSEEEDEEDEELVSEDEEMDEDDDDDVDIHTTTNRANDEDSTAERGGIIEEVILENFMCHRHLKTVFGPKINFITGPNGSGKSAVLVALAVGLGAKTSFTNRGKRLDSVITNEQNYARVRIRISNRGRYPFKPELYGRSITVERYIKRGGGGSYKVKGHDGKTVSSTRADIVSLVEHYNIQVNNPCAILMQDTSRQYLAESTPKTKYSFLLMATQLSKSLEDYEFISDQLGTLHSLLQKKKRIIPQLKDEIERLEQEYKELKELRNIESDIRSLKDLLKWAYIQEKEKEVEELQTIVARFDKGRAECSNSITKLQRTKEQCEKELSNHDTALKEISAQSTELGKDKATIEAEVIQLQKLYQISKSKMKDLSERQNQAINRRKNVEKKIAQIKAEAIRNSQREIVDDSEKIEKQKQQEQILAEKRTIKQQLNEQFEQSKSVKMKQEEVNDELQRLMNEQRQITQRIDVLNRKKQDISSAFGRNMPQFLKAIRDNQRRFQKPPVGPIGLEIKLKDPKWALAVEEATGGVLKAFVLDNVQDSRLLQQLGKQHNVQPQLIVSKHEDFMYQIDPRNRPDESILTVLHVLDCGQNPVVFNTLIDQGSIHSTALVEDRVIAEDVIKQDNVQNAYLRDGSRMFSINGARNFNACKRQHALLLTSDTEQEQRRYESDLKAVKQKIQQVEQQSRQLRQQYDAAEQALRANQRKAGELDRQERRLVDEIEEITRKMNEVIEDPTDSITEMENTAEKLARDEEKYKSQYEKTENEAKELKPTIMAQLEKLRAKEDEINELAGKTEEIARKIHIANDQMLRCDQLFRQYNQKLLKIETAFEEANDKISKCQEDLQDQLDKTKENTAPRDSFGNITLTPHQIDKKITEKETSLRVQLQNAGRKNIEELMKECVEKKKKFRQIKKGLDKLENFHNHQKASLEKRCKDWRITRGLTTKVVRNMFIAFLSQKGHAGNMAFDHKKKELHISIQLDKLRDGASSGNNQTVNSLSGGERSFSTVSLLMALWSAMETPFTAMDEFDVFMDQVSRMKSTEMLMGFARSTPRQQFIFITPQSLQTVKAAPDLTIIAMLPPRD